MSIDPLDRPHNQQPVPGQDQNLSHSPEPDFITDNPDVQPGSGHDKGTQPSDPPKSTPDIDPNEPGLGNPLP
ncbi:hypothetical protein [Stutzerimonas zhaodongensis]|jgi:hypothetical protein|uniref:hypothetical protein n=1 Tax=Stutzerimonas zhaodongensis TaxID=1176257 RepID=UPI001F4E4514|nr:hypothetical protein [Stutzerimonas zhaodongensis]UNG16874.1 hypothetical protein MKP10_13655 [Stutzerimonas zhaodongensis]